MFMTIYFFIAVILLLLVLYGEKKDNLKTIIIAKPILSIMFIVLAVIQQHSSEIYYPIVLTGLGFCLIGDICLVFFFKKKIFLLGLVAFLIGHIFYFTAFLSASGINIGTLISLIVILPISFFIFLKLQPHLGNMKKAVIAYISIISIMVVGAASLFIDTNFTLKTRVLVLLAAVIFYCSDLFVARHRFVKKEMINRYFSLPLYYIAQFLLAYSTGLI